MHPATGPVLCPVFCASEGGEELALLTGLQRFVEAGEELLPPPINELRCPLVAAVLLA
jgi:hypothetical protein